MTEELRALLNPISPTYNQRLPAGIAEGITIQIYAEMDETHESGKALCESVSYRVRFFSRVYDEVKAQLILKALRNAGWTIGAREWVSIDSDNYYHYAINIEKQRSVDYGN